MTPAVGKFTPAESKNTLLALLKASAGMLSPGAVSCGSTAKNDVGMSVHACPAA